jgi:tetratricopeptide (TPR) repeat protein
MITEPSADRELLYGEVTDAILADLRAGREPDLAAIAARYPTLADELETHAAQLAAVLQAVSTDGAAKLPRWLGDFYLLRVVGHGGMGMVYEAEQVSLRRRVALKVLPNATLLDPLRRQRFQHEAQAAARLHHPHIVPVFAVGSEGEVPYYAMQFIDGPSIAAVVHERRRLIQDKVIRRHGDTETEVSVSESPSLPSPLAQLALSDFCKTVARWGVQAASALHYAHEVGVIHRDVKPANLLLDQKGDLWVTDFGLARLGGEAELTATGDTVGTLRYMSPEQAQGAKGVADHRVDVYGLGATLYELLTLEPAVPGDVRSELLRRLLHEEPHPPRSRQPAIPRDLETIVLKALRKEPAERYATAKDLADDLQLFLDGQPVRARRPTRRERAVRWARRRAVWLGVAGGVLVLLSVVLAVSTFMTVQAYEQAKEANDDAQTKQRLAERRREYAERSRALARRAVDQVLAGVVRDWLDADVELEPGQRSLLQQLLLCCQELALEEPGDAEALFRVAQAQYYEAAIQLRLAKHGEAIRGARQALATLGELDDKVPAHRQLRARGLTIIASAHHFGGDRAAAEEYLREAITVTEGLRAEQPEEQAHTSDLATLLANQAFHLQGDPRTWQQSNALFERAAALWQELRKKDPNSLKYVQMWAGVRCNHSVLLGLRGRRPDAEAAAREAMDAYRALVKARPAERQFRDGLARGLGTLADQLSHARRDAEALPVAQEAVQVATRLANDYPQSATYVERHASNLGPLIDTLVRTGKIADAEAAAAQAVDDFRALRIRFPQVVKFRGALGESLVRLGHCRGVRGHDAEAEAALREAVDILLEHLNSNPTANGNRQNLLVALADLRHAQGGRRLFANAVAYHLRVVDRLKKFAGQSAGDPFWISALGVTYGYLGALHLRLGEPAKAEAYYRLQLEQGELLVKAAGGTPASRLGLGWFLSDCPAKSLRDPQRALDLVQRVWDAMAQKSVGTRTNLAAAFNGVGRHRETAELLKPYVATAPDNLVDFWRHWAIAQHHLGNEEQARAALGHVVRWINTGRRPNFEQELLLAEVNDLLGNPEPSLKLPPVPSAEVY